MCHLRYWIKMKGVRIYFDLRRLRIEKNISKIRKRYSYFIFGENKYKACDLITISSGLLCKIKLRFSKKMW